MSSAAKLRTRGIAIAGATAIVMTSFGPAAFAWTTASTGDSDTAGTGSIGLVDTQKSTIAIDDATTPAPVLGNNGVGTQGATAVTPGGLSEALGDVRIVVPQTFERGDYIDLALDGAGTAEATNTLQRVTFATTPVATLTGAFAEELRVDPTSDADEADTTEGVQTRYVPGPNAANPAAPDVTVTLVDNGSGPTTARVTFNSTADTSVADAKSILTLSGLKANVGSAVPEGNITLTGTAFDANGAQADTEQADFFGTPAGAQANVTIPGYVSAATITAAGGSLTADGTTQEIGDVAITRTSGAFAAGDTPAFTVSEGLADSPDATATYYDAAGRSVGEVAATVAGTTVTSAAAPASATTATRVVFSGVNVTTGSATTNITYTLTNGGTGSAPTTNPLTAPGVNQADITLPERISSVTVAAIAPITRLGGSDRYETAAKVAARFGDLQTDDEVDSVVLASGESFPDALSAGYLAQTKNAPVLLTQRGQLPQIDREFMRNRGVKNVYIVGGNGAVSADVENALRATEAYDVTTANPVNETAPLDTKLQVVRITGTDRYDTNKAVNQYAAARANTGVGTTVPRFGQSSKKTAILANGATPWDALAAGPLVAGEQGARSGAGPIPVILTAPTGLSATAGRQMDTLDIGHAIIVGGTGAVSASTVNALQARGTTATRLSGANRYATASAINTFALRDQEATAANPQPGFGFDGGITFIANGGQPAANAWADALALGPVAAEEVTVINLTAASSLPTETATFLDTNASTFTDVIAVGLGGAVSTEVANRANSLVTD